MKAGEMSLACASQLLFHLRSSVFICGFVLTITAMASAQALDEVVDEDRYLRGLTELELPEVLQRYLELHPPADAAEAVGRQQHLDRLALRDAARSIAEREAVAQRMIARHDELLEKHPHDLRRAAWITEQAGDAYFEWMMIDTSVWTALLGVPSPDQKRRIQQASDRMIELAERAERIVLDVIFQLEDQPGFMDDLALQSQRRRLIDEHRDRRVPFLHGVAMHLQARFNAEDSRDRAALARRAAEALNDVIPRLEGHLQHEAAIHAGYARLLEGDAGRAAEMFSRVRDDAGASPLLRFAAAVGQARLAEPRAGASAALRTLDRAAQEIGVDEQLFYELLLADQRLILRDRPVREAYRAHLDLIDSQPDERRESVRRAVLARLAGHATRYDRPGDAPPPVQIAHASSAGPNAESLHDAIERLHLLRERAALSEAESALALLVLARLHNDTGEPEEAARALIELARSYPQHPDAMAAVESSLVHAAAVYRTSPSAGRALLRDGFDLLFEDFPHSRTVDHWRLAAGRLALREDDFEGAIDHFAHIARDSNYWHEGRFMQVSAARRAAQLAVDAEPRYTELLDRIEQVERDLTGAESNQAREWLMLLRVYRAESHLALDDAPRALRTLDELDAADEPPASIMAEMLPIRIRAYEAIGRTDLAGDEIDRLVGASPERAFEVLLPMIDASERRVEGLIRQDRSEAAQELARRELLPLAERLDRWHERYGEAQGALAIGLRLADAHRYAGECESALSRYDQLLTQHPNAMPLLLGRAECLFALGEDAGDPRLAEAMGIYRRIAAADPAAGEEPFWLSHVRMLQILDRINHNTDRILPRIQQLRLRDDNLGGDYYRRQFEQLLARYAE